MISDLEKRIKRNERNKLIWSLLPLVFTMCIGTTMLFVQSYKESAFSRVGEDETIVTKDNVHELNNNLSNSVESLADISGVNVDLDSDIDFSGMNVDELLEYMSNTSVKNDSISTSEFVRYMYSTECTESVNYKSMMQELQFYNIDSIDWSSYAISGEGTIMYEINKGDTPIFLSIYYDGGGIQGWEIL